MRTRIILICFSLLIIGLLVFIVANKHRNKDSKIKELPDFEIPIYGSNKLYSDINETQANYTVVIFFSPDCDYCDDEISGILNSNLSTDEVKWIFITNPMVVSELPLFLQRNPTSQLENSDILIDSSFRYHNLFGVMAPPASFVFKKGKLQDSYLHFVSADKLIQKLTK